MLTGSPGGREVSAAAIPMMSVDLCHPGRIDKKCLKPKACWDIFDSLKCFRDNYLSPVRQVLKWTKPCIESLGWKMRGMACRRIYKSWGLSYNFFKLINFWVLFLSH